MKEKRPPIVTVLGHVDHGKTTLLDVIRKSNVASREAGGITQSIGASKIETKDGPITFVDTPGHAAFSGMRERGAKVADIAILMVAATEGPKPQTLEALDYIKKAKIPFIVAFSKMDLPSANLESALSQMEKEGVLFEGRGGDTPYVAISAKNGDKIDDLVELVHLVADVSELSGDKNAALDAVVIETNKDKRGLVVSVVVRDGTLKVGNEIFVGQTATKVRGLFDEQNKQVKEVYPGDPVLVLGFSELPSVGAEIKDKAYKENDNNIEENNLDVAEDEIPIVLKAASEGSLEALKSSLPKKVAVLKSDVGDVTESDIFFAKSAGARIFVFEAKASKQIQKLASTEEVDIESFRVIYELIERLEELIKSGEIVIKGKAEIVQVFPFNKKKVAGCKIIQGEINIKDTVNLVRGGKEIGKVKVASIRKQRDEVNQVKTGEECGIIFEPQLAFEPKDMLISVASK